LEAKGGKKASIKINLLGQKGGGCLKRKGHERTRTRGRGEFMAMWCVGSTPLCRDIHWGEEQGEENIKDDG